MSSASRACARCLLPATSSRRPPPGKYGAATFLSYAEIGTRAINHRAGLEIVFTAADAAEAVAFGRMVIAWAAEV
jgi:hypothetical protein